MTAAQLMRNPELEPGPKAIPDSRRTGTVRSHVFLLLPWTETEGSFLTWRGVTNTLPHSLSHLPIHKRERRFHGLGVKPEDCTPLPEWLGGSEGRCSPCALGYFTALPSWFPHQHSEDRHGTYLMARLRGFKQRRNVWSAARWHKKVDYVVVIFHHLSSSSSSSQQLR